MHIIPTLTRVKATQYEKFVVFPSKSELSYHLILTRVKSKTFNSSKEKFFSEIAIL